MKITGYQLREALKLWDLRKTAAQNSFKGSLYRFAGEEKDPPLTVAARIEQAELSIVKIQVAQMVYNVRVRVKLPTGVSVTLAEAVKLSGVASRQEAFWKGTTVGASGSVYYDPTERDGSKERAQATITAKEILDETTRAARNAGQLRAALASANAVELDIEDLEPSLFE